MSKLQATKDIFKHYFRTAFEASGLSWNADNEAEIEAAVESIVDLIGYETQHCDEDNTPDHEADRQTLAMAG